ncbi:MAG: DUF1684 domain-containing protein [Acidobacteria bacterium]|nr:DUF1684 domain-containing protein [Acidobacteriota bacterium]
MRRLVSLLSTIAFAAACTSGPPPPDDSSYVAEVTNARAVKDRFFAEGGESPIPAVERERLLPLPYFEVDTRYNVPAVLRLADERPIFEMPTSTGAPRRMQRVGVLEFTLDGRALSLGAFIPAESQRVEQLFVPFADETTGTDTYEAGRYLDINPTATGLYTIDFNHAYNPYCAYNQAYECPFPPPSNRLPVAILAGEKKPVG